MVKTLVAVSQLELLRQSTLWKFDECMYSCFAELLPATCWQLQVLCPLVFLESLSMRSAKPTTVEDKRFIVSSSVFMVVMVVLSVHATTTAAAEGRCELIPPHPSELQ